MIRGWPLVPKITVLIGLFALIIAAGWWFVWNDQFIDLETKEREEETLKQQFLDKKRQAVNLDLYVQQLAEIDRSFGALLKQLPDKSEIEALLIEINQAGLGVVCSSSYSSQARSRSRISTRNCPSQ
jgi:type IV pilus assembly protein PilO